MLRGAGPDGRGWLVDVEDPGAVGATLLTLRLRDRAVATSAPNRRRWRVGADVGHHLIDPRRGRPAISDLAQVTVVADRAETAEVVAKTVFVLGATAGTTWLRGWPGLGAVLVGRTGAVQLVGDLDVVAAAEARAGA
ncbi:MAG: FAD:protein FMN transferase [Kofleriaceae bacterium]|nr:FAD:protein FMN transferase [Kofleriaceae bacterium]